MIMIDDEVGDGILVVVSVGRLSIRLAAAAATVNGALSVIGASCNTPASQPRLRDERQSVRTALCLMR
jgi:hypothetical protein